MKKAKALLLRLWLEMVEMLMIVQLAVS